MPESFQQLPLDFIPTPLPAEVAEPRQIPPEAKAAIDAFRAMLAARAPEELLTQEARRVTREQLQREQDAAWSRRHKLL